MPDQTSVPQPTFGPTGFVAPAEADILAGVQQDINAAFGGRLNPALATPQGQLASSEAAIIGDAYAMFLYFCNQVDPAFNSGRMQDAIARIYFITRIASQPTVVIATCTGLPDTPIPVGALAQASDGNLYLCTQAGTIGIAGSVDLTFACAVDGPIECPAGSLSVVYQAVNGWDTITNVADGVPGRNVESRGEFEARRGLSTGWNAMGPLGAILGGVLSVPDVLDAYVTENDYNGAAAIGGVDLLPNSVYVCVLGGEASAVAQAIWTRKMPGCAYNGNTEVIVSDPNPAYSPPVPTYRVIYQIPDIIDFAVLVKLKASAQVPADAEGQIQAAVLSAFAGTDGGPRAKIGSTIYASRYYGPIAALGAWATQIVGIQVGTSGTAAALTGAISGAVMTATAVSGLITAGALLQGSGVVSGTTIIRQLTGDPGGVGTYAVSAQQTVSSRAMDVTDLVDSVQMRIDQAPSVAAVNVHLQIQP